jgi:membrane fusion protein (multidrug efflux system)
MKKSSLAKRLQMPLRVLILLFSCNTAFATELTVMGVIRAQEEVVLRSEFAGIVHRIAVREGERVREGQLLVELKNGRQKIAVELSRARLAKANASLTESKVLLENATKELGRVKIAGDALPRKELEERGDQVLRVQALLEAQEAELKQAKEEVNLRENELKETHLLAPFSGTVTEIYINRGDTLKPVETQVLQLVALDRLYAELLLPVSHVHKVHLGHKVKVQVESNVLGHEGQLQGTVIHINPKVDASSRTFRVKIGIPSANGRVRPGMLAQASFGS